MLIRKIKSHVKHQDIGGKNISIDPVITSQLCYDTVFNAAITGNIACYNFIGRRTDYSREFQHKLYYGKVDGLGYIVAEDELE